MRNPLKTDYVANKLYRGSHLSDAQAKDIKQGGMWRINKWTSVSKSISVANNFKGGKGYLLIVQIPLGCNCAYDLALINPGEQEILIPPYTLVEVVQADHTARLFTIRIKNEDMMQCNPFIKALSDAQSGSVGF